VAEVCVVPTAASLLVNNVQYFGRTIQNQNICWYFTRATLASCRRVSVRLSQVGARSQVIILSVHLHVRAGFISDSSSLSCHVARSHGVEVELQITVKPSLEVAPTTLPQRTRQAQKILYTLNFHARTEKVSNLQRWEFSLKFDAKQALGCKKNSWR